MDILKKPIITKAARALVCLFALLALIGSIVTIASSARAANMDSISSMDEAMSIINTFTGAAAMARAMSIVCFILSLCTVALAYFSQDNFLISIGAAVASLIQFIMGLVLSPLCSIMGIAKLGLSGKDSGSYLPVLIVLMLMAIAVGICNVLGILINTSNIPLFQGIQQKVNNVMPNNMMGQPQQPYQPGVPQPTQAQQPYQQPVPQPTQAQQPYQQGVPQPTQAQQPYQQPVPQPTQAQQPYQQGVPQPTQPQQYQQPNDFNHQ